MSRSKFFDKVKSSVIEREVEDVYNQGISLYFKNPDNTEIQITHPYACDGLISTKTENGKLLKLLIEYKFDEDFQNRVVRAKVICQALYYVKQFELNGQILPNVIMIADKNECFVFHSNDIIKYLDEDVDWKIAPSSAGMQNPELVLKIANDGNINPFVFVVDENFSFNNVSQKIRELADNVQRYVHVTEHNIATIFEYFTARVIKNKKKISAHDLVGVFIGVITDTENYYKHPVKKNTLVTPLGNIEINGDGFDAFFAYFQRTYTPQEKNKFAEIADRLIEDTNRRNSGDFWTPTPWVDYAHKMITEQLGDNWKDEYVVWDNCCGSKNLTRDYRFNELYCSTLFESELEIGKRYNPEATSFQFDFLNDELEKLPKGLIEAFEQNKKIVFFLNPPYATNSNIGNNTETNTVLWSIMKKNNLGNAANNLYAQFLYRILTIKQQYNLNNCYIALFSPTLFISGSGYSKFRSVFLKDFTFNNGIQFKASHFADVADNWGISFSIWNSGETQDKNNFLYSCMDIIDGDIIEIQKKNIYNIDGLCKVTDWVKSNKILKLEDVPTLSNGITVKISKSSNTKLDKNAIGCYFKVGNIVDQNTSFVALFSSADTSNANGLSIMEDNFEKCMSAFSTRKLIEKNWINSKDEYLAPNEEHPLFNEFVNDSIVYSLFHSSSNQSSLRQVEYKDKLWDIKNEFFWMSKSEIEELANEYNLDTIYNDARTSDERFVYNKLQGLSLSPEAKAVLEKASELVRKSFKYREMFSEEHPEYQLDKCWDAGWYQIKALLKEYMKDELKEFQTLYKTLADKMKPQVYELGFLKK